MGKRQGVSVILRKPSGKILMQLRDNNTKCYPNKWCFPGGGLDEGETHIEAAVREVSEECGLLFHPNQLFYFYETDHDGFKTDQFFVCSVPEDLEVKCFEGQKNEWKTLEEVEKLDNLVDWIADVFPTIKYFLEEWWWPTKGEV